MSRDLPVTDADVTWARRSLALVLAAQGDFRRVPDLTTAGAQLLGENLTILGNAGDYPILRNQRDTQLVYNISSAHWEKHTLKLGTDLRKGHLNDVSDNYSRGFWTFGAVCNGTNYGSGVAAFMAGCSRSKRLPASVIKYCQKYGALDSNRL